MDGREVSYGTVYRVSTVSWSKEMEKLNMQFEQTKRTKVNRTATRASYDKDLFNTIVDEVKFGHLAFSSDNGVHSIPMLVWRNHDSLYFHCSVGSRLAKLAEAQTDICISFATIDGYVFAKSAFKHSVNYRSAVIYGKCELVNDNAEKLEAFKKLIELYPSLPKSPKDCLKVNYF